MIRNGAFRIAVCLLAAACGSSPSAFAMHFSAGERAETAGRHAEAASLFDAASRDVAPKRERDHATFLAAMELARSGDLAGGAAKFEAIVKMRGEHAAQARWQLLTMDIATNAPSVTNDLDAFVRTYPNDGLAYPALEARLRIARAKGGDAEALAVLRALEPAIATTDSAARVAFEIAECTAKLGKLEDARAAFIAVASKWPYPGEYFDDALFRASELDETLSHFPDAVADLERMLVSLESSTLPGTYVRPKFPDAAWRIAVLYRDKIGDKHRALGAFERYRDKFPNALRRDEALWQEAKLSDDEPAACDRLSKLVRTLPDSRYVPCAVARCANIARPKNSHAPPTCHAYLTR